jgi:MHS family proline/betaine transporter-like MFS transporter
MSITATATQPATQPAERTARRVSLAASIGNTIETFDYAIYGFMATVLAALFFPDTTEGAALLSTFAVFGAAFAVRPLGSLVFGPLTDRIGRRPTLVRTLLLMALATAAIGALPTAASVGVVAPVLLVALRLIQGLAAGGEYGTAMIYAAEFSPRRRRGQMTSRIQVGSLCGFLIAAGVVLALHAVLTTEQVMAWGWRVPFLLALPMGAIGLYVRSRLGETPEFEAVTASNRAAAAPVRESFRRQWPRMLTIVGISALHIVGIYMVYTYVQSGIIQLGYSPTRATLVIVLALAVGVVLAVVGGTLVDRWGRRPLLFGVSLAVLACAYPLFAALSHAGSLAEVILWAVLLSAGPALYSGVVPIVYVELIPVEVRGSGVSIAYNLAAAAFGGSALYICQWLVNATGDLRSPAFLLMAAAAVSMVGALVVARTREAEREAERAERHARQLDARPAPAAARS